MRKKQRYWPRFHVDPDLMDVLVKASLIEQGIYNPHTYFRQWRVRIRVWTAICGGIGLALYGFTGALIGTAIGPVMPLVVVYLSIMVPMLLVQLLGLFLGICGVWLLGWAVLEVLLG